MTATGKKRLFLAVNLSLVSTRRIADAIARMRPLAATKGLKVAWVPPANLHVTLKFLGWAGGEAVEAIRDRVAEAAKGLRGFEVGARGAGAFPTEHAARVLWVGVQDASGSLKRLAASVDAQMAELGFAREERAYSPHVTIGRVKEGKGAEDVLAGHRVSEFGNSLVREVVLYESQMKSTGSEYVSLFRMPLDAPPFRAERQTREVEEDSTQEAGEEPDPNGGQQPA